MEIDGRAKNAQKRTDKGKTKKKFFRRSRETKRKRFFFFFLSLFRWVGIFEATKHTNETNEKKKTEKTNMAAVLSEL